MNTPILFALIVLISNGVIGFMWQIAGAKDVSTLSWMTVQSGAFLFGMMVIHVVQRHPFGLAPGMAWLASLTGLIGVISVFAIMHALRIGGQGSIIFPISGLGVMLSAMLSFLVFREPITATKLLGLGFGVTSIIFLSR
tara:strand:- start:85 stop:501 length:417 start_codon:yes stop_codon:yes gene_type:complete